MSISAISPVGLSFGFSPVQGSIHERRKRAVEQAEQPKQVISSQDGTTDFYPPLTAEQKLEITEAKYGLACRLAAYYKTQYEQLRQTGTCLA